MDPNQPTDSVRPRSAAIEQLSDLAHHARELTHRAELAAHRRDTAIIDALRNGMTQADAAKATKLTQPRIAQIVSRHRATAHIDSDILGDVCPWCHHALSNHPDRCTNCEWIRPSHSLS